MLYLKKIIKECKLSIFLKRMVVKLKNRKYNVKIGKKCNIALHTVFEGSNVIQDNTCFSGKIGFGSYIGTNCVVEAGVGRYTCIASHVRTVSGRHPTRKFASVHPAFYSTMKQAGFSYVSETIFDELTEPSIIGNDVWIGSGATLVAGVKIGDGAIIGAGALVAKDVAPYTIVSGVPAKVIRNRFEPNIIAGLMKIKWWDWDESVLRERARDFCDVEMFVNKYSESGE